jgi:dihydrofolate reductase
VKLILIAALTRRRVIGAGGRLPWHLSDDLKRFKQLTTGHTVLMGRRTYESIGKPLPNRRTVVLSSRAIPGVETYSSLDAALTALKDVPQVFVIGGGMLYAQTLDRADALHLTIVEKDVEGDTFFPPYEGLIGTQFRLAERVEQEGMTFEDYVRM